MIVNAINRSKKSRENTPDRKNRDRRGEEKGSRNIRQRVITKAARRPEMTARKVLHSSGVAYSLQTVYLGITED